MFHVWKGLLLSKEWSLIYFQYFKVEAKNCAIRDKEAEYLQAEEEKQKLQDQLAQERLSREEEKYKMQEQLMNSKAQEQVRSMSWISSLFYSALFIVLGW